MSIRQRLSAGHRLQPEAGSTISGLLPRGIGKHGVSTLPYGPANALANGAGLPWRSCLKRPRKKKRSPVRMMMAPGWHSLHHRYPDGPALTGEILGPPVWPLLPFTGTWWRVRDQMSLAAAVLPIRHCPLSLCLPSLPWSHPCTVPYFTLPEGQGTICRSSSWTGT